MKTPPRELTEAGKRSVKGAYDALKAKIPGFKQRRAQLVMIGAASRALGSESGVAAVEAKTGTGKSLGYLCAGVPLAQEAGKKLVISTASIALQEQLFKRDIPLFLESTGLDASVALAKGRGRFVCPRQLSELMGASSPAEDMFGLDDVAAWSAPPNQADLDLVSSLAGDFREGRWNGDLDAIDPLPPAILKMVRIPAAACPGRRCAFAASCPMLRNRQVVKDADIIVTNHDLLLADLGIVDDEGKSGTLVADPEEALFVIDEGHHLGNKALRTAEYSVVLVGLAKRFAAFKKAVAGALRMGSANIVSGLSMEACSALADQASQEVAMLVAMIRQEWVPDPSEYAPIWRAEHGILPDGYRASAVNLSQLTNQMLRVLAGAGALISNSGAKDEAKERAGRGIGVLIEELESSSRLWSVWASLPHESRDAPFAKWIELADSGALVAKVSAVRAAPILEGLFWSRAASVLVTSATLASGEDFTRFAEEIGLPGHAELMALPSPFDLENNASFEVPWLGVQPNEFEAHVDAIASWLDAELDWDTGSLVLFSSKRKLAAVLERLSPARRALVLAQGSLSKASLVATHTERVKAGGGSVIFGTNQMGEGLDLPGLLKTVVVTQMPFAVPTEPVLATLAEWYEKNGRNPFMEIVVPEAIRVLTQYCGRLIRREDDMGRIVCLDSRLIVKFYGKTIINALPPFRRVLGRKQ